MADIEVVFASNAPQYEREIDGATASTKQAELATDKLTKSQERLSRSFKQTQADAKVIRNAMSQLTGGQGNLSRLQAESTELAKRRTLLSSIGKQAIQDARLLDGALGGSAGSKSPLSKFLAAFGKTGSLIGRSLGLGGGFGAAIAGLVVFNKAMEITNYILDVNKQRAQAAAEAHIRLANNIKAANEQQAQTGLSAARSQGRGLKALAATGPGLIDLSNTIAQKYGIPPEEAQRGVLAAHKRFGAQAPLALDEAGRAFATGLGPGFTESLDAMSRNSLKTKGRGASRIIGADINSAERGIQQEGITRSVQEIERVDAQRGVTGQRMIPQGVGAARGELAAAVNPLSKIMLEQYTTQQQQLTVLREVAASQGIIASALDRILNPQTNAQVAYLRAASTTQ